MFWFCSSAVLPGQDGIDVEMEQEQDAGAEATRRGRATWWPADIMLVKETSASPVSAKIRSSRKLGLFSEDSTKIARRKKVH